MQRRIGFAAVVAIALALTGCATTPVERQEATSKALADLQQAMIATRAQIDQTLTSLNTLTRTPEANLRDAYQQFAKDADTMFRQAERLESESRQMRRRSEAWLAAWKEAYGDVKDAELRAATEQRREQVLRRFFTIDGSLAAAHQALTPFIANLRDLRKVLSYDLTTRGIAAVSNTAVVTQANENGKQAARTLEVAIADLESLLGVLTPAPMR